MNININISKDKTLQNSALRLSFWLTEICSHKHFHAYGLYQLREKTVWQAIAFKSTVQIPSSNRGSEKDFFRRQWLNFPFYPLLMWADLRRDGYWDNLQAAGTQQGLLKGRLHSKYMPQL